MSSTISHIDQLDRLRMQRGVEHLHALGARATMEFLLEIGSAIGGLIVIAGKLNEYQRLTPAMVRAASGDRFPPKPMHVVPRRAVR